MGEVENTLLSAGEEVENTSVSPVAEEEKNSGKSQR